MSGRHYYKVAHATELKRTSELETCQEIRPQLRTSQDLLHSASTSRERSYRWPLRYIIQGKRAIMTFCQHDEAIVRIFAIGFVEFLARMRDQRPAVFSGSTAERTRSRCEDAKSVSHAGSMFQARRIEDIFLSDSWCISHQQCNSDIFSIP
jgi:hypothetical protein